MSEKIRATVLVDRDLWKEFRMLALKDDKTATDLINDYVEKYVEKNK